MAVALLFAPVAGADIGSRIWATGGVTTIEGSAGGGLVPWALLGSYASDEEWGGTLALSRAEVDDYSLSVTGAGLNWNNRLELTVARQTTGPRDCTAHRRRAGPWRRKYPGSVRPVPGRSRL